MTDHVLILIKPFIADPLLRKRKDSKALIVFNRSSFGNQWTNAVRRGKSLEGIWPEEQRDLIALEGYATTYCRTCYIMQYNNLADCLHHRAVCKYHAQPAGQNRLPVMS